MTATRDFDQPETLYEVGGRIRTEVLGAAHVAQSTGTTPSFGTPMQQLVTEYCWGSVWSRPGLDRRTRSLVNLSMLTALNRQHEIGVHIRGARNNGCTKQEIQEVLLQTAIYCGVPAAMEAFRTAEAALAALDAECDDTSTPTSQRPDHGGE